MISDSGIVLTHVHLYVYICYMNMLYARVMCTCYTYMLHVYVICICDIKNIDDSNNSNIDSIRKLQ